MSTDSRPCLGRRDFLFAGATTLGISALGLSGLQGLAGAGVVVRRQSHERMFVCRTSALEAGVPRYFQYPYDHPNCRTAIVRTGKRCGGGVGPDQDIVAFNMLCTHMGGLLEGNYDAEWAVAGPCPLHLTTFDLTRYGMVVAGHATEGLPQVLLELEGDELHAVGVQGLMYGFGDNEEGA